MVGSVGYIYLSSMVKKTPTWIGQVKFLVPQYTIVQDDNYLVQYYEILPQPELLDIITERRLSGKLIEVCNVN